MKREGLMLALALAASPAAAQTLGEPCLPGTADRNGMTCAPGVTSDGDLEWMLDPGHVLNAAKGDALLSTGCGLIGQLMLNVRPRQVYDHTGIMIEDGYAVRHSTAAQGRLLDNMVGSTSPGSDGFDPEVLQFGWPGTISQASRDAFEGAWFADPDGAFYKVRGFNAEADAACDVAVNPAVLKPAPDIEQDRPQVRDHLRAAADASLEIDGHYRFYGYTDGLAFETAPPETGWAAGSIPTVCSSFVRHALKAVGVHLEGGLEPSDCALVDGFPLAQVEAGACVPGVSGHPETDGLYFYTEAERQAAAGWLHQSVYDLAYEEADWYGALLTDAPDDTADQFTNCMAFDWCGRAIAGGRDVDGSSNIAECQADEEDAKDSNCWKAPGIGRAVSPDDMLRWDGPEQGGVYGHKQDLIYRGTQYVQVHRWQSAAGRGGIKGWVTGEGLQIGGAEITSAGVPVWSAANGAFAVGGLPPGPQTLRVCKRTYDGDGYLTALVDVDIEAGEVATVNIDLTEADDCPVPVTRWTRAVTLGGHITLVDDEDWGDDEIESFPVSESMVLDGRAGSSSGQWHIVECAGDEVRAELWVDVRIDPTRESMVVSSVKAKLYEGSSCDTDDLEVQSTFVADVPPTGTAFYGQSIESDEWNSPDRIDLSLHLENAQYEGSEYLE